MVKARSANIRTGLHKFACSTNLASNAQDETSDLGPSKTTPSKHTNVLSNISSVPDVNSKIKAVPSPTKTHAGKPGLVPLRASFAVNAEDFSPAESKIGSFTLDWVADNGKPCEATVSEKVHQRLRSSFTCSPETFESAIRSYLKRKYLESRIYSHLYSAPVSFYILAKEVFSTLHELFADNLNGSGILRNFCSLDSDDALFGSCGSWEEGEDTVEGVAGNPPFTNAKTSEIVYSCEAQVRKTRPYPRLLLLPFHEGSALRTLYEDVDFYGEIIVTFKPGQLGFRRQIDLLRNENEGSYREWTPLAEVALAVWVNKQYRILFPVPADIDECFTIWVDDCAGEVSGLNFSALLRAFPLNCRNGDEKAGIIELAADGKSYD